MLPAVRRLAAVALLMAPVLVAHADEKPPDALAPKSRPEDALARQLHTATYVTDDLDAYRRFYGDGLGLTLRGPLPVDPRAEAIQRQLWGIPEPIDWQTYLLERPDVPGTIQIRLLVLDRATPLIHSTWDAREPGPFSTGYPAREVEPWDGELRALGFDAMNPMSKYQVPRPDGSLYWIHETIFKAPAFMHAVTIGRMNGMRQLGPVSEASGRGGPVYSAQSIRNSDEVLAFYTDVLGMELRSDREWKSHGSEGALAVPDGTVFRFSIVYAKGARDGHLLFIDFRDDALPATGVAPRPPNQGMAIWSFPVSDLSEVLRRAQLAQTPIVHGPIVYASPSLGHHRALSLLAPNGFLVELFEPVAGSSEDELSATEIVRRATEAAGGEAWRRPETLHLEGVATLFRDGGVTYADRYEMWRVFPTESDDAHRANGRVRFDAFADERIVFQTAYDGEHTYDQNGRVPPERAQRDWSSAFGFGILRFALDDGFELVRLPDDEVDGHPCHSVKVVDPSGSETIFAIDRADYSVRMVGFSTPRGWHHRLYSDFAWHEEPRFRQPTRVRLYYDGVKTVDIEWRRFEIDVPLEDELFVLAGGSD